MKLIAVGRNGLTLIELIVTVVMLAIIVGVSSYIFRAVFLSWAGMEERRGLDITLYRGIEEIIRDLREAKEVSSVNGDEVRFTQDNATYYIYYLYNSDDSYPPDFDESEYELKKAQLTGGIDGTFTYGGGKLILTDIIPPDTSDMSISGNIVTIDLSVSRDKEAGRSRTEVRPRNL
ncbi:MAG: prepilin-type N-terminal cleavage/methylation domain-containing protein [Candidatus Omnitrophica bacterium]|nr:prepilin-type N-terminal cleavage/methylation domain-containing protein [Candidatus Omnitrophota bacterium]